MLKLLPKIFFTCGLLFLLTGNNNAVIEIPGWVVGKIKTMTLKEKIGQMFMVDVEGQDFDENMKLFLSEGYFGGVILFASNLESTEQTKILIKEMQTNAITTTGIPLLVSVDQEGGLVNRLGSITTYKSMEHSARTIGRLYNYSPKKAGRLVNRVTRKIALRMKNLGFNMNMAPVLDLTDNKDNYIYDRSYGNDPRNVSKIAEAYIKVMHSNGIATTGKHFPNLGKTVVDTHKRLATLNRSLQELTKHEFRPFMRLKNDLSAIMVGHIMVPSIDSELPSSISKKTITLLRNKIGFKGVIVSDDIKMGALSNNLTYDEIVLKAVEAGIDLIIMAWDKDKKTDALKVLESAVLNGVISKERIDSSVERILLMKHKFAN